VSHRSRADGQAVSEDISYIESQNRGLQVQTSNQQALLDELRQLLVGVQGDKGAAFLTRSKSSRCRKKTCALSRKSLPERSEAYKSSKRPPRRSTRLCKPAWIKVSWANRSSDEADLQRMQRFLPPSRT